jgi:hypothetical protein
MSKPVSNSPHFDDPTADDLAGVPLCLDEDQPSLRVRGSKPPEAIRTRGSVRGASAHGIEAHAPTDEDLAGIPIFAEGDEDLMVRPRKPNK